MRSSKSIDYNKLNSIDWSFSDFPQETPSKLHPYPARFIECIPRTLIDILGCPKDAVVFDPFCGSGTTLYEAQKLGHDSIGVDLNPIACLISRVKTRELPSIFESTYLKISEEAKNNFSESCDVPIIPNLDHWFEKDIQIALSTLMSEISRCDETNVREALQLALSSIIVRVSNQDSDTRYASVKKNTSVSDVYNQFVIACERINTCKKDFNCITTSSIINKDILSVTADEIGTNIGLVITSPPYPNAYEYWLYHKYRMWWLGFDPIKVRSYEIGARPHYQKKNGQTEEDFSVQLDSLFKLFDATVLKGGHICIVIGRSIIKGKDINNADIITCLADQHEYSKITCLERNIITTRKSFNPMYGKINKENILVFRKDT